MSRSKVTSTDWGRPNPPAASGAVNPPEGSGSREWHRQLRGVPGRVGPPAAAAKIARARPAEASASRRPARTTARTCTGHPDHQSQEHTSPEGARAGRALATVCGRGSGCSARRRRRILARTAGSELATCGQHAVRREPGHARARNPGADRNFVGHQHPAAGLGLPLNQPCRLIVRSRAGGTEVAGAWDAWRAGPVSIPASAAWRPADISSLQVATTDTNLVTVSTVRPGAHVPPSPHPNGSRQ